jgi:hypothetical protein
MENPLTILSLRSFEPQGGKFLQHSQLQIRADKWPVKNFWPKLGPAFVYNERVFQKDDGMIVPGPIFCEPWFGLDHQKS